MVQTTTPKLQLSARKQDHLLLTEARINRLPRKSKNNKKNQPKNFQLALAEHGELERHQDLSWQSSLKNKNAKLKAAVAIAWISILTTALLVVVVVLRHPRLLQGNNITTTIMISRRIVIIMIHSSKTMTTIRIRVATGTTVEEEIVIAATGTIKAAKVGEIGTNNKVTTMILNTVVEVVVAAFEEVAEDSEVVEAAEEDVVMVDEAVEAVVDLMTTASALAMTMVEMTATGDTNVMQTIPMHPLHSYGTCALVT